MANVVQRVLAAVILAAPLISAAQQPAAGAPAGKLQADAASQPQAQFAPSMGDLMTLLVQPRHIKLGLAGRANNWAYAAYEVGELRGAFLRVGRAMPVYNKQDLPALIAATTAAQLTAVQSAIKRADRAGFEVAYANLTAACNACHISQRHAAVVIKSPMSNPYVDQEFRSMPR